jgi:hydroxyacylglutathione hydrolase
MSTSSDLILIESLCVTAFSQNCRIIACPETREAVVVDPGGEAEKIAQALTMADLNCRHIWLTHSHLDHCGGVRKLKAMMDLTLYAHPEERSFRETVRDTCKVFGLIESDLENCPEPETALRGGESLTLGKLSFQVIHAPGHSPGSLCYYCPAAEIVLVGDVLFSGSVGRTDLPGGSYSVLMRSIRKLLLDLPPATQVLSGHGPETTLGYEKETNPFLTGALS